MRQGLSPHSVYVGWPFSRTHRTPDFLRRGNWAFLLELLEKQRFRHSWFNSDALRDHQSQQCRTTKIVRASELAA
eukprot:jgi/Botrbrau1/12105/Bobra.0186s0026.1